MRRAYRAIRMREVDAAAYHRRSHAPFSRGSSDRWQSCLRAFAAMGDDVPAAFALSMAERSRKCVSRVSVQREGPRSAGACLRASGTGRAERFRGPQRAGPFRGAAAARRSCPFARPFARRAPLDEPFSSLDASTRSSLQRDVRTIARKLGVTLIIVTHDINEAALMADRAFIMTSTPGAFAMRS